jgi:uncharacterized protein YkwD
MKCLSLLPAVLLLLPSASRGEKPGTRFEMSRDETALLEMINKERAAKKLPALKPQPQLFRAAREHSANMARQDKMEHVLDGKRPPQRVKAAGYRGALVGENIAAGEGWPLTEVMSGWMKSRGHRENILDTRFIDIGIGLAKSSKGETFYTTVFARPVSR